MQAPPVVARERSGISASGMSFALAASACWGAAVIAAKAALDQGLTPLSLVVVQVFSSLLLFTPALIILRAKISKARGTRRILARPAVMISGAMEYALTAGLFAFGVAWTTAGNAALINAAEPVFIAVMAVMFLREPLSGRLLIVLACVTAGLLLVMSQDLSATGIPGIGDIIVLASALSGASYAVMSRRLVSHIDPLPLAWAQQAWGLATLLVLAAIAKWFHSGLVSFVLTDIDWRSLSLAVASGLLANAAAVWLHLHALRRMPASSFAVFLGTIPVFTLIGASILLNEPISLPQLIGGGLIIAAAIGASRRRCLPTKEMEP